MDRRAKISQIIVGLAEYYDKALSVTQLSMYVEDLMDLSPEELLEAVRKFRKDPKNDRFPLPSKIRSMLESGADPEGEAHLVASRLAVAVTYGTDRYGAEKAKALVGKVGWAIVETSGGWERFNRSVTSEEELPILKAQWRNLAKVFIYRGVDELPKLPDTQPKKLEHVTNLLRTMPTQSRKAKERNE